MNCNVLSLPIFDKQAKRLARKFPSIKHDLAELIRHLSENPEYGTPLGSNFYKIRWAISSKGKGKSGGMRIITYVKIVQSTVILTTIYDKSEKSSLSEKELDTLFKLVP